MSVAEIGLATLAWLGTYLVHSTLLLGGIYLLTTLRPVRSPRLRERVWAFGILGGLATAALQLAIGIDPLFGRWRLDASAGPGPPAPSALVGRAADADSMPSDGTTSTASEREDIQEPRPLIVSNHRLRAEERQLLRAEERTEGSDPGRNRPVVVVLESPDPPPVECADRCPQPTTEDIHRLLAAVTVQTLALSQGLVLPTTSEPAAEAEAEPSGVVLVVEPRCPRTTDSRYVADLPETHHAPPHGGLDLLRTPERPAALFLGRLAGIGTRVGALPWRRILLGAWLVAGLAGLLWFLSSWSRLFAHLRNRRPLEEGTAFEALARLRERAQLRARVRLTVSPTVPGPITLGILRREICVPERALHALSPAQIEAMLAHELGHVVRWDAVWFHVLAFVERVFFFQPLNRVARRQLHDVAEVLCDDLAVRWTGRRLALASCLTEIARWLIGEKHRRLPVPAMAQSRSRLGQRVERLLDDRRSPRPEGKHRWFTPLAIVLTAGVVAAVPGVTSGSLPPVRVMPAPSAAPVPDAPATTAVEAGPALVLLTEEVEAPPGPAAAPAPVTPAPGAAVHGILSHRMALASQLDQLEAELALLRGEFEELHLTDLFEDSLEHIDQRVRYLRARRERMNELVERLVDALEPQPDTE